jgi:hypothetical protein
MQPVEKQVIKTTIFLAIFSWLTVVFRVSNKSKKNYSY